MTRGTPAVSRSARQGPEVSPSASRGAASGKVGPTPPIRNDGAAGVAASSSPARQTADEQPSAGEVDDEAHRLRLGQAATTPAAAAARSHGSPPHAAAIDLHTEQDRWQPQTPPLPPHELLLPTSPASSEQQREETQATAILRARWKIKPAPSEHVTTTAASTSGMNPTQSSIACSAKTPEPHRGDSQAIGIDPIPLSPICASTPSHQHFESQEVNEAAEQESPRKSLFDIEDEEETQRIGEMYTLLTAAKEDADSDGTSDKSDAAYETRRNRKLLENQRLLAQLGLGPQGAQEEAGPDPAFPSSSDPRAESLSRGARDVASFEKDTATTKPCKRPGHWERKALKLAEDGTTTSLPRPGTIHELAYIDVLPVRDRAKLDFLFVDRFPVRAPTPTPPLSPGVKPREPRASVDKSSAAVSKKKTVQQKIATSGPSAAASPSKARLRHSKEETAALELKRALSGTCCHQCRRKNLDSKMHCRQIGFSSDSRAIQCLLHYCQNCCLVRYGIGDEVGAEPWDPSNSNWTCPRCRGICNCSLCMHKAGLSHCIPQGGPGSKAVTHSTLLRDKNGQMKYRSVKHFLEEAKGVTQIGPKRTLSMWADSGEIQGVITEITRLKAEVKEIRERRRQRAAARLASPRSKEEGRDGDISMDFVQTKRSIPWSWSSSQNVAMEVDGEGGPLPRLPVKPRKPGAHSGKDLAPNTIMAAIVAWRKSLDGGRAGPSSSTITGRRQSSKAPIFSQETFGARESQVWIKGEADQYYSDTDSDVEEESEQEGDRDERGVALRPFSEISSSTSLSDLMSWRRDSVSLGTEAEEQREERRKMQAEGTIPSETLANEHEHLSGEHNGSAQQEHSPYALQRRYEGPFYQPMHIDPTSLELRSCVEPQIPQLTYTAENHRCSSPSLLISSWSPSPYSAKGRGPLGVDSGVDVGVSAQHFSHPHPHSYSFHVHDQEGEVQGEEYLKQKQEEEQEVPPLYQAAWPLRPPITDLSSCPAPHPRQMFFSPSASWQKTRV